jgi:hypothetical protein
VPVGFEAPVYPGATVAVKVTDWSTNEVDDGEARTDVVVVARSTDFPLVPVLDVKFESPLV